jgi:cyclic pyranopterin phosphate synthase
MLYDPFMRSITNVRISLTQRCNLNCSYCHREGHVGEVGREMSSPELERFMKVAASLGITRVKLTGGEPTLRSDLTDAVKRLAGIRSIDEISMTTNGTLLADLATDLKEAGLDRVNITMDSLKPDVYSWITGHDSLRSVLQGIEAAVSTGLTPVKVNVVVLRTVNDSELQDLIDFSSKSGVILQLIELVTRDDSNEFHQKYHCDLKPIEDQLMRTAVKVVDAAMHRRRKYVLSGGSEVEIVRPMHNTEFCSNCHRIRLTSDGKLKPCLMLDDNLVDVLGPMRRGITDTELSGLIRKAVSLRRPYFRKEEL